MGALDLSCLGVTIENMCRRHYRPPATIISKYKCETIEHFIQTIHLIRSKYESISFCIAGDFNRVNITDILDSYGNLHQVITVKTRKGRILEQILTDLKILYHPPSSFPPLKVDENKNGKDRDHNTIIFAPVSNDKYKVQRKKTFINSRPIPESKIPDFGKAVATHSWEDVYNQEDTNDKVEQFHYFLHSILDFHFTAPKDQLHK